MQSASEKSRRIVHIHNDKPRVHGVAMSKMFMLIEPDAAARRNQGRG